MARRVDRPNWFSLVCVEMGMLAMAACAQARVQAMPVETITPVVLPTHTPEKPAITIPTPTIEVPTATAVPPRELAPYQQEKLAEIVQLYAKNGVIYQPTAEFWFSDSLEVGEVRPNPGVVVMNMTSDQVEGAQILLQVAGTLLGQEGTAYLHNVSTIDCSCAAVIRLKTVGLPANFANDGQQWRRSASIHELIHILDLSSDLYSVDDNIELDRIKAEILFSYDPVQSYTDLYLNVNNPWAWKIDQNVYFSFGRTIIGDLDRFFPEGSLGSEYVRQKIREYESDGFSNFDVFQIGRDVFRMKRETEEGIYSPDFENTYSQAFGSMLIETFAAMTTDVLMGSGSKYSQDERLVDLVGVYLKVARFGSGTLGSVDMDRMRHNLRYLDPEVTLPYVVGMPSLP